MNIVEGLKALYKANGGNESDLKDLDDNTFPNMHSVLYGDGLDTRLAQNVETNILKMAEEGGGSCSVDVPKRDVNFYDYDGTVVASYSANDFLQLSEMPKNPTHEGLISQGWNWSYDSAIDYVSKYGLLEVGQSYITDNGATRMHFDFSDCINKTITICFTQSESNGCLVDWGDGVTETFENNGVVTTTHTFQENKKYIVSFSPSNTCNLQFGAEDEDEEGYSSYSHFIKDEYAKPNTLKQIYFGKNISKIIGQSFYKCCGLNIVTFPVGIMNIDTEAFGRYSSTNQYDKHFESIILPTSCNYCGSRVFYGVATSVLCFSENNDFTGTDFNRIYNTNITLTNNINRSVFDGSLINSIVIPSSRYSSASINYSECFLLKKVVLGEGVTILRGNGFKSCNNLETITLPKSLTNIANDVFRNCSNLVECHLQSITPPTVVGEIFSGTSSKLKIYVPMESVEAYKAATNWSTYADRITGE